MKKVVSLLLISFLSLGLLCGCNIITTEKNSIGKAANTAITTYAAIEENFVLREMSGYKLYGVKLNVNSENVGKYTYIYTDKSPNEMQYSDILIVEINTLNGKIEKMSSPEYATYESEPYEMIKSGMPLNLTSFTVDSDVAIKTAEQCHFGNNFVYNYVETTIIYENGAPVYKVGHVSLVNDCVYRTVVDAITGTVITSSVEDLV